MTPGSHDLAITYALAVAIILGIIAVILTTPDDGD